MSVLLAWIEPASAIVAVDTSAISFDGSSRQFSKLMTIPHLNAAVSHRGQGAMLNFVFAACLTAQTFDEMLDSLTSEHLLAIERHLINDGFFTCTPEQLGHELVAVGYSARQSRMVGKAFVKLPGATEFTISEFTSCVSPWDASMGHIPRNVANCERLARAQVRWLRTLGPGVAGGGDLIVCKITKRAIEIRHALTFPAVEVEAACS